MAFLNIKNVRLAGISATVPKKVVVNTESTIFPSADVSKFIATTGVERYRVADEHTTTSDLALDAAKRLLEELKWDVSEIGILVFVSQTPDYLIPNTAPIIQDKLNLPKSCIAFDMTLGCSGYVFGLSTVASYMAGGNIKKGLLLCGDTPSKSVNPKDKTSAMLFGDAGTATALEYDVETNEMVFGLGSDGSGYKSIIINEGGYRNPYNANSLTDVTTEEGITRNGCNVVLDGMDVFSFGINQAPASVKETIQHFNVLPDEIDYFVFHQANMMMNEMIRKKLKLDKQKVPYSIADYGNTSSASIPLTVVQQLKDKLEGKKSRLLFCGFGVGLSWGSCVVDANNIVIPEISEI